MFYQQRGPNTAKTQSIWNGLQTYYMWKVTLTHRPALLDIQYDAPGSSHTQHTLCMVNSLASAHTVINPHAHKPRSPTPPLPPSYTYTHLVLVLLFDRHVVLVLFTLALYTPVQGRIACYNTHTTTSLPRTPPPGREVYGIAPCAAKIKLSGL